MDYIYRIRNEFNNYSKYRISCHIGFWMTYIIFLGFTFSSLYPDKGLLEVILYFILVSPFDVLATYLTVYVLISKFLLKRKYWEFALLLVLSSLLFVSLQRLLIFFVLNPIFFPWFVPSNQWYNLDYFYTVINIYPVVAIFASIKFAKGAFIVQRRNEELEKERLEAELKFLKSQIHPHFLFNTLNNLYALTLDKSDQAPEVVIKLSNLLDYMLYEANTSKVPLLKEVDSLKDYIKLENIRYGDNANIDFEVIGDITGILIAPLILLPFIENSFKHGLSQNTSNHWVEIKLICKDSKLNFSVNNGKAVVKQAKYNDYTEGIGLKNVRRRLEILYPNKHRLNFEERLSNFKVELEILFD